MERETWDRLLAEYATGGLSETDRKQLMEAALADQELFEELMAEESVRELIEMPGARARLVAAMEPEEDEQYLVAAAAATGAPLRAKAAAPLQEQPVAPAPEPPPFLPRWLAWVAGIAVVFLSATITYRALGPEKTTEISANRPVEPPANWPSLYPKSATKVPVAIEEPPEASSGPRPLVQIPREDFPLPEAPPPVEVAKDKVASEARQIEPSSQVRREVEATQMAELAAPQAAKRAAAPATAPPARADATGVIAGNAAGPAVAGRGAAPIRAKVFGGRTPRALYSTSGAQADSEIADGVVNRTDQVVLRWWIAEPRRVVMTDRAGSVLAEAEGAANEVLELPVPAAAIARAGSELEVFVREEDPTSLLKKERDQAQKPAGPATQPAGTRLTVRIR